MYWSGLKILIVQRKTKIRSKLISLIVHCRSRIIIAICAQINYEIIKDVKALLIYFSFWLSVGVGRLHEFSKNDVNIVLFRLESIFSFKSWYATYNSFSVSSFVRLQLCVQRIFMTVTFCRFFRSPVEKTMNVLGNKIHFRYLSV